ncbi:MAG TPA: glycosyl hydrolase [Fibrobacteria bacterium]|nr:glycosyl hydrolase [Fibrobacteria bacterium]HOX51574.1 glycosyl hydrolase [Fibrobacteria bacterium]
MNATTLLASLALATASQAAVSYAPVTPGATGSAQKLYNFLATNYGVRTISGVMTGDVGSGTDVKAQVDVDTLYRKSGKYPTLVGFDFLFATGVKASDSWYKSYTATTLAQAKDLWSKGGIPAFTWHWKDPSDSVDAFYTKSGNPKEYTTFDFTKGFLPGTNTWDTNSATYKQLVADIDEIAALFLSLQKDSVAAVFRPLHEASGGWFWWGTQGGAAYQALYNLVHDRMVDVDGVKNLVWVWNPNASGDISWNPGATKYDVISLDIYGAYDYTKKFVAGYGELSTNFAAANKIFAVSENGPIPDASTMKKNDAVWSWWMPWYQSWGSKFLDQTVDAVWKANMADPCVITLDEMPGWSVYALSQTPVAACTNAYALGDLDSTRTIVEVVPADTATNGWLQVKFSTPADDTAKGNIVIASGTIPDLSTTTTLTMKVVNGNPQSGIWFTVAFLGNAATSWGWAQPDGCWVNAGESTTCTFDLATTTKDKVVLKGADYTTFMSNLNKVYIEIFGEGFSGSIFYDDVVAGTTVINNFDKPATILSEQAKNLVALKTIGKGSSTAILPGSRIASHRLSVSGNRLALDLDRSGPVSVSLLDLQGRIVSYLHQGNLAAGRHELDLGRVESGVHLVRIHGAGMDLVRPVTIP